MISDIWNKSMMYIAELALPGKRSRVFADLIAEKTFSDIWSRYTRLSGELI